MKTTAFIGTGNMGGALARAACRAVGPDRVVLYNRTADKARLLAEDLGCSVLSTAGDALRSAQYVFLCVKPQNFPQLARELSPALAALRSAGEERVLVSVAAGLTLERLEKLFPGMPVLRLMPNACVAVGKGALALAAPPDTSEQVLSGTKAILARAGLVERLPESLMDPFTALAGCGPAFADLFMEGLADGGVMAGLPRAQAMRYAAQTLLGAAALLLETGAHPGQLKDAVCSPGGSTIAGVAALERSGFRAAAIDAVLAAWRRNQELGK